VREAFKTSRNYSDGDFELLDRGVLPLSHQLKFDRLGVVTTADVLADPDKFIGKTLADPIEGPSYGRGKAKLYSQSNGKLIINSFAHGGMKYSLRYDLVAIRAMIDSAAKDDVQRMYVEAIKHSDLDEAEKKSLRQAAAAKLGLTLSQFEAKLKGTSGFEMNDRGLWAVKTNAKGEQSSVWVSAPFEIVGACRNPHGTGWGLMLKWKDADGSVHEQYVSMESLHGDLGILCGSLSANGLNISLTEHKLFATHLSRHKTDERMTVVAHRGWHVVDGRDVFVLPDETISSADVPNVVLDANVVGPYAKQGTLAEWQAGVGALSNGHVIPTLAISAAFAGPLLHLAGLEGGGIHLYGSSSTGKTTIAQDVASVWGRGDSKGFVRGWTATANGMEAVAASATDTCLILDEAGMVEPKAVQQIVYALSNGAGKARMNRDTTLRDVKTWRVMTISTGEVPIPQKIAEERGKKARAGQLVRILDINADRGEACGIFDSVGDSRALADAMKKEATTHYGTAGQEFVRRLIAEGVTGEHISAAVVAFVAKYVGGSADGQVKRAAARFGVIAAAGEYAIRLKIVPWKKDSAEEAAAWALKRWIEERGGVAPAEKDQAIRQVRKFIEENGESRFDNIDIYVAKEKDDKEGEERIVKKKKQPFGFRDRAGDSPF
jgi:putative DNA primase/helicase